MDVLKDQLERAKTLHFKMCRASLDDEGMAVSDSAITEIWVSQVLEEPKTRKSPKSASGSNER